MFAEDLGGDTVSSRTFPLGSVNSKAGLLTSGAFSSDPMPMDGSCWHESSGVSSTIWEPRPCEVTALFSDETDEYDVSYCRGMGLLLMNLSRVPSTTWDRRGGREDRILGVPPENLERLICHD